MHYLCDNLVNLGLLRSLCMLVLCGWMPTCRCIPTTETTPYLEDNTLELVKTTTAVVKSIKLCNADRVSVDIDAEVEDIDSDMDIDITIATMGTIGIDNDAVDVQFAFEAGRRKVRSVRADNNIVDAWDGFVKRGNNANNLNISIFNNSMLEKPSPSADATNSSNNWMTQKNFRPTFDESGGKRVASTIISTKAIEDSTMVSSSKKLHFPMAPNGERILLDEEPQRPLFPLTIFTAILGVLQPVAFPLECLKEAVEGRLTIHALLLQVTKLEALIILWSICWLIAAAYVPYVAIGEICCRRRKFLQRLENQFSASSLEQVDSQNRRHRHDRHHAAKGRQAQTACHTILFNVILLILIANIGLMFAGSEQASRSIDAATAGGGRGAVALEDAARFARNSEMQIAFVTTASLEIALDAVDKDLQDAENLLGKPIKGTFGEYYNLENTFLSLKLIQQDSMEISKIVAAIKSTSMTALEVTGRLQRRLDDLVPLVQNIRQVCSDWDVLLCDTITANGLVVTFNTKDLISDGKLIYFGGISGQTHFNSSLHEAEMNYQDITRKIALETSDQRAAIRTALDGHRGDILKRLRTLETTSRALIASIKRSGDAIAPYRELVVSWEMWRYLLTFGLVIFSLVTWMLLLCAAPCCCAQPKVPFAILGGVLGAVAAILAWFLATSMLIVGVHSETFICRPLYDSQYRVISNFFDASGTFYPKNGLIKQQFNLNDTVPMLEALKAIENNKTIYKAFNLKTLLDIDALTDHSAWTDVVVALSQVRVQRKLKILTPPLENSLLDFTNAGGINLTLYRSRASRPTVSKDLRAFHDQVYTTGKRLRDERTKGRFENLTYKLRDIIDNDYKELNNVQDKLIYHITALEVLLTPLVKRAENVLVNLTKFQQSINFKLETITRKHVVNYTNRLENYLVQFRTNVLYEIKHRTAKTGPLWHIFAAIRVTLCDGCVDGINALSFACYLSILTLVSLQPVLWSVVRRNQEQSVDGKHSNAVLHRSVSEELIHPNWQTPRAGSPDTIVHDREESVWVSPRQANESYLPPPLPRHEMQHKTTTTSYQQSSLGFDQTNWAVERSRDGSPVPSSTRRWI